MSGLGRTGPLKPTETPHLTAPERAAWRVAVRRGLPITVADVRELLAAARAAEARERGHQGEATS
jgi:hypothetical protein